MTNLPVSSGERPTQPLRAGQLALLWACCAVSPAIYRFANLSLPPLVAFAMLALGGVLSMLAVALLVRSAKRHGLGFAGACRAVLGSRGGSLLLLVRWAVGMVWLVYWAENTARWITILVQRLPNMPQLGRLGQSIGGVSFLTWMLMAMGLLFAWGVMAGGVVRIVHWAKAGLVLAILSAGGLLVLGGNASQGFGTWWMRTPAWRMADGFGVAGMVTLLLLPLLLSSSDLLCAGRAAIGPGLSRNGRSGGGRAGIWMAWISVPLMAVCIAFVGACLASASMAVRQGLDFSPIADGAGFGGYAGALAGVVLESSLWVMGAPLWGFAMTSGALSGAVPRLHVLQGSVVTLLITIMAAPWIVLLPARSWSWETVALWVAAPWGLLLADEWIWRRGKVWMNALAAGDDPTYGAWGGVSLAGLLGLIAGWMWHPTMVIRWGGSSLFVAWTRSPYAMPLAMILGMLVAAGVYLLVRPLENTMLQRLRRYSATTEASIKSSTVAGA